MNPGTGANTEEEDPGIPFFMDDSAYLIAELRAGTVKKRQAAATGLGKSGNPAAIPLLAAAVTDPHPSVRCGVVQANRKSVQPPLQRLAG
jgi:HEAT repeat protein